ncbi:MAG: glycosyltransferase 61 family protein [Alphaproteobacteria bacterium]
MTRTDFLVRDAIEPGAAMWGHLFDDPQFRSYGVGRRVAANLPFAHVIGTDGLVYFDGRIVAESIAHLTEWEIGSAVRRYQQAVSVTLKVPLAVRGLLAGRYFMGFSGSWRNYAHWVMESLPRLCIYARDHRPHGSVLVLPRMHRHGFQWQYIRALGIGESDVFEIDDFQVYAFQNLTVLPALDLFSVSELVREAGLQVRAALGHERAEPATSVYIRRGVHAVRRATNFEEMIPVLDAFGYHAYEFEYMTVAHQVEVMAAARCVVAEHGAGVVNIVFCGDGARVLELFSPSTVQPAHWSLASISHLRYGFQIGRPVSDRRDWNENYLVDCELLRRNLDALARN